MSFLDNLGKFIDSPEGRSMAAALLKNKGSFGEGLGGGLLAMEEVDRNKFKQENQNSLLGLKREGLDLQRMSTEASIQNMRQSRAESYQRLKMMMDDRKQKAEKEQQQKQMLQGLQSLIGQPGQEVQTPEIPGVPYSPGAGWSPENLATPASTEIRGGSGLLGGKVSKGQFNAAAASVALGMGDVKTALSMLNPKAEEFGAAREVIDPATGQPILAQIGKRGTVRPVQGALPAAKNGTTVTTTDGTVVQVGGAQPTLGKATENKLKGRQADYQSLLNDGDDVMKFARPEYLETFGRAMRDLLQKVDKNPQIFSTLSKEQQEDITRYKNFNHKVEQFFHKYVQMRFGTRVAASFYPVIRETFPNTDMSPSAFNGVMHELMNSFARNIEEYEEMLTSGRIDPKKARAIADKYKDSGAEDAFKKLGYDVNKIAKKSNVDLSKSENKLPVEAESLGEFY